MTVAVLSAAAALFFGLAVGCFLLWYREREQVTWLRARLAEATALVPRRPVALQQDQEQPQSHKQHGGVR